MKEIDLKNFKRLLSVKASAGSGKTFRLANRYISLLNIENNPANIVAITFTNKAANEMKERIIRFLTLLKTDERNLNKKDKKDRENVIEMVCKELGINEGILLKEVDRLIKNFLTQDNNIQTIDSFIHKILRKFSFYAGIRSNFEIRDIDEELIFKDFLKNLDENEFYQLVEIAKKEEKFSSLLDLFEELYEKDKELKDILKNNNWDNINYPDDTKAKESFKKLKDYILNSPHSSSRAHNAVNIDFYEIPYQTWFSKNSLKEYQYFKKKALYQEWFDEVLENLHSFFRDYFLYKEAQFFKNLFDFYKNYKDLKWQIKRDENAFSFKDIEHLVYKLLQEDINTQ
jgi:exodeoxyribonuclease V beta subunit